LRGCYCRNTPTEGVFCGGAGGFNHRRTTRHVVYRITQRCFKCWCGRRFGNTRGVLTERGICGNKLLHFLGTKFPGLQAFNNFASACTICVRLLKQPTHRRSVRAI